MVEAKDTVISPEKRDCILRIAGIKFHDGSSVEIAQEQAKATWEAAFEAGKLEGRREVVVWVLLLPREPEMEDRFSNPETPMWHIVVEQDELQDQLRLWFKDNPKLLKDWGIE